MSGRRPHARLHPRPSSVLLDPPDATWARSAPSPVRGRPWWAWRRATAARRSSFRGSPSTANPGLIDAVTAEEHQTTKR